MFPVMKHNWNSPVVLMGDITDASVVHLAKVHNLESMDYL